MMAPIARLWRHGASDPSTADVSAEDTVPASSASATSEPAPQPRPFPAPGLPEPSEQSQEPAPVPARPEQPVLLTPAGRSIPVVAGELLPATRRSWVGPLARLPVVPKRAILAVGVCAGLAAPALARHLASQILFGGRSQRPGGSVIEVTRIVYSGPLTTGAADAIGKVLTGGRR